VLGGASLGLAALMARQQFVDRTSQMDAVDLKTLAQFYLLGDPSVHPIAEPTATVIPTSVEPADAERFFRAERRQKMKLAGDLLTETKPTASKRVPTGMRLQRHPRATLLLLEYQKELRRLKR
jgi:hypothetical protein